MRLTFQQGLYIFVDEYERFVVVACIQVNKVKKVYGSKKYTFNLKYPSTRRYTYRMDFIYQLCKLIRP